MYWVKMMACECLVASIWVENCFLKRIFLVEKASIYHNVECDDAEGVAGQVEAHENCRHYQQHLGDFHLRCVSSSLASWKYFECVDSILRTKFVFLTLLELTGSSHVNAGIICSAGVDLIIVWQLTWRPQSVKWLFILYGQFSAKSSEPPFKALLHCHRAPYTVELPNRDCCKRV